jgi:uncharacterized membrane protein YeaQ/YmgE (transglycosylase-associated protein family)
MERPASIQRFEQFYWAHIVLGLVGSAVALWLLPDPRLSQISGGMGGLVGAVSGVFIAVAVATQILLWYLIARRGNLLAKYVLAGLTALNLIGAAAGVIGTVSGAAGASPVALIVSLASSACLVAAVAMLYRPDTTPWFREAEPA